MLKQYFITGADLFSASKSIFIGDVFVCRFWSFSYHPNILLSHAVEVCMNIHNCCLSCYRKFNPHDFFFGAFFNSFPVCTHPELKVEHFTSVTQFRLNRRFTLQRERLCPKMWKLIKLLVDYLHANSLLEYALTDYVGLVLSSGALIILFCDHYFSVYFAYLSWLCACCTHNLTAKNKVLVEQSGWNFSLECFIYL